MILGYGFDSLLTEADNVYDLVGNCFGALCKNIDNHQEFTSRYLDQKLNPNITILNKFSEDVMEIMEDYSIQKYNSIRQKIFELIDKIELQNYMEPPKNHLTVIYCILAATDSAAGNWDIKRMSSVLGPLDKQHKTNYRVYFIRK